jgi:hypothetical protein
MRLTTLIAVATACAVAAELPSIHATERHAPPEWAVWQRKLISAMNQAAPVYLRAFTYRGGALKSHGKVDDDYECFRNWPLFYAIGGDSEILDRALEQWNAVTRYWTYENPALQDEFIKHYDMLHLSEAYVGFQYFGLADPAIPENVARARRFASYYLGMPNYDARHRIIRSPFTGAGGPLFHSDATYMVNYGHASLMPFLERPEKGWENNPGRRAEIQALYDRVVMSGDVIMNLAVTGLVAHAYIQTGEERFKRWVLEYVDAWMTRIRENNGIIPDNVGLNGVVGENRKGQWWGGFFGWTGRYSLEMIFNALITASEAATLVSGDRRYLDLLRSQIDVLLANSMEREGDLLVPYRYGPNGWEDFRPLEAHPFSHLWKMSMSPADWKRIERLRAGSRRGPMPYAYAESPEPPEPGAEAWRPDGSTVDWKKPVVDMSHRNQHRYNEAPHLLYLAGENPDWPIRILEAEYARLLRNLDRIRSGNWQHPWRSQSLTEQNPVFTNGLAQMTMGAPYTCFNGGLLQARLRYFDPLRRRPGLPPDVAALIERMEDDRTVARLENLSPLESRRVTVQAGAFGEHRFLTVAGGSDKVVVNGRYFEVELAPGTGIVLDIAMERLVNQPSYDLPWSNN